MNEVVYDIVKEWLSDEEKLKKLDELEADIAFAREIISGKFQQCPVCKEYFLTKTFFVEKETEECEICVYDSPINSGDNEYIDGYADTIYSVCPKGHRTAISRSERKKS